MAKTTGNKGEQIAAEYLLDKGYTIVKRNYHSRYGEIDIIATKGDIIAFVEVKTRKKSPMVTGFEAVGHSKQQKIIKTALSFMQENPQDLQPRFDVCVVEYNKDEYEIDYLKSAFWV